MNVPGYTTQSLLMMHGAIANALAVDDNTPAGQDKPFMVRTFPDWKLQADEIEAELTKRGVSYTKIGL
ncbi:hypothetical protein [Azospirillum sp. Sh1]|uniref:hypothetical protein n=1 Tax=Azospirillum sp. Sh1 TaxID=2607285 RepID=UPI0011EE72BE|nr:hypothetical protein [Azospirillum sp. Sh1]KAA0573483.1 hypothetical protein FZ029_21135 [Azospirillum sp. Sh1]